VTEIKGRTWRCWQACREPWMVITGVLGSYSQFPSKSCLCSSLDEPRWTWNDGSQDNWRWCNSRIQFRTTVRRGCVAGHAFWAAILGCHLHPHLVLRSRLTCKVRTQRGLPNEGRWFQLMDRGLDKLYEKGG
jgi:hypothetical protein